MMDVVLKAGMALGLFLGAVSLASAHVPYHRHYVHRAAMHRGYAYRPAWSSHAAAAMPDLDAGAFSAYHHAALGYGNVPEDPLIPLKVEVPPPVDPNEPASGSYGAMLEGRNPAPGY